MFYGLRPWEIERLTMDELGEYQTQMRDLIEQNRAQSEEA